jgi:anti-anti-sigma regulatory factor
MEATGMVVRLNGQFDIYTQSALREGLRWVRGPVVIHIGDAWLASAALGELLALANRIGPANVELADPSPFMRKILAITQIDRILRVTETTQKAA